MASIVIGASMSEFVVAAFYHFTRFEEPTILRSQLQQNFNTLEVKGSILLAHEGLNGTIAGPRGEIAQALSHLRRLPGCAALAHKESHADHNPFLRMKIKLKKEIVTMGKPHVDPLEAVGTYIEPKDWNAFLQQDDVVAIDTRNTYEVELGRFRGAIDPKTASFGEFPDWWEKNKARFKGKRVAMYCTGGIRCEKSTNYLLGEGVKDVYHLRGGILKYLEAIPEEESAWEGECFVFDARVSVTHGLKEGAYQLCYACRMPLAPSDFERPEYEHGVSCHQCIDHHDEDRKARFRERQKQVTLAQARGTKHMG